MPRHTEEAPFSADSGQDASSAPDRDCVLAQLTDMFGDVAAPELISNVCVANNWRVDHCIDHLIKHLEFYGNETPVEPPPDNKSVAPDYATYTAPQLVQNDFENSTNSNNPSQLTTRQHCTYSSADPFGNEDMVIESIEAVEVMPSEDITDPSPSQAVKLLGAIPKSTTSSASQSALVNSSIPNPPYPTIDFSSILKKGFKEFVTTPSSSTSTSHPPKKREASDSPEVENLLRRVNAGYKIMIIMRGAPGCGKSFLSRSIVDRTVKGNYRNHIFSSDDYFYNVHGRYVFKPDSLPDAHEFNQKRVRKKAAQGWSPLIVDNTNIKVWEMGPYIKTAVLYGYLIDLVEPENTWAHSAGKLAAKNEHGVTKDTIERMLNSYEPITVPELLRINHLRYTTPVPQYRHNPPFPVAILSEDTRMDATEDEPKQVYAEKEEVSLPTNNSSSQSWGQYEDSKNSNSAALKSENAPETDVPKPARETVKRRKNTDDPSNHSEDICDSNMLEDVDVDWKSYEEESSEFWHTDQNCTIKKNMIDSVGSSTEVKPQRSVSKPIDTERKIFSILKEKAMEDVSTSKDDPPSEKIINKIERHKLGCKNESKSFALIRQIYPNKQTDSLWDLFEKCNGDVEWAVDLLIKEDSSVDQEEAGGCNNEEFFNCRCDAIEGTESSPPKETESTSSSPCSIKGMRQKSVKSRDKVISTEMLEAKRIIENQFKLSDEFYSTHVRKIRDLRHPNENEAGDAASSQNGDVPSTNNEDDRSSGMSEEDESDMVEIHLGNELITQLEKLFGTDAGSKESSDQFKTNVFMHKSLAKQIYAVWMESMYNQLEEQRQTCIKEDAQVARILEENEEQRQRMLKEDEEFAQILGDPETYQKFPNPPKDYKEILDMDLAWSIYMIEHDDWKNSTPRDLASHLTQLKLCEIFPNIEKNTLLEILAAHGNRFADTVEVLKDTLSGNIEEEMRIKQTELIEKVKSERQRISDIQSINRPEKPDYTLSLSPSKKAVGQEEAKKQVLKDFEECRNLAVHHSQLKAECYMKAKDAIQKGNTAVAVYYSQIASLHKEKVEMYNHKAANCIMEVHDLNQTNPDFIDLHYLHVAEALQCLDIFIDKHINKMKNISRSYKHLFIITGRGLHSAGGISAIKNKVKARLKERNLKWSEVNPGLLKVKVFSASKYSKNY